MDSRLRGNDDRGNTGGRVIPGERAARDPGSKCGMRLTMDSRLGGNDGGMLTVVTELGRAQKIAFWHCSSYVHPMLHDAEAAGDER